MRTFVLFLSLVWMAGVMANAVHAATDAAAEQQMYLTDMIKITMRSGKGVDHKIIAMLKVGQKVGVLGTDEGWTHIRTESGKEGWVLSRFVSAEVPNRLLLEQLRGDYAEVSKRCAELEAANETLVNENQTLEKKLERSTRTSQERIEKLARENKNLKDAVTNRLLKWFLAGAGVLLVGFLIGYRARRREKRRLYL